MSGLLGQVGWAPVALWGAWVVLAVLMGDGGPTLPRALALALMVGAVVAARTLAPALATPVLALELLAGSLWFASLTPRDDRDWLPEQSRLPDVELFAEGFEVRDLRTFRWTTPTEGTPGWTTQRYRFADLVGADLGISRFSELEAMAHVFVSFRFADGRVLCASVEVRKERGESFDPVRGLFRHYEKIVVLGDELDVVGLRALALEERVELHPLEVSRDGVEQFLRSVLDEAAALHERPAWYHTVTASCSTSLSRHLRRMGALPFDHRVLFPGYADTLAHELGWLGAAPLAELRERHRVDEHARDVGPVDDFSARLRDY